MLAPVSNDRLTLQELSWLLAQEARGAARALRQGVTQLQKPSAPPADDLKLETNLDTLDDAIGMLSHLQTGTSKSRRGRIDLAALLYELAPHARIEMAPGAGTEVFGDEAELRRMLHVLVEHTNTGTVNDSSPELVIVRDHEFVRISVDLGPDRSPTAELERRWLSRMATRMGGKLELERGRQSILLPADGASDQREVVELRKELEQAQQLGETYARELAGLMSSGEPELEHRPAPSTRVEAPGTRLDAVRAFAAALTAPLKSALGTAPETEGSASRHAVSHRLLNELGSIAELDAAQAFETTALGPALAAALAALESRRARRNVTVTTDLGTDLHLSSPPNALGELLQCLVRHAVAATPRDGSVRVSAATNSTRFELVVEDGGPTVPRAARQALIDHRVEPATLGRPAGFDLLVASLIVEHLGGSLSIEETSGGRASVHVSLPLATRGAASPR
jgi:signal transduction histidine kinase